MSIDHAIRHGIIGGPTQKPVERCPVTNRIYEFGVRRSGSCAPDRAVHSRGRYHCRHAKRG